MNPCDPSARTAIAQWRLIRRHRSPASAEGSRQTSIPWFRQKPVARPVTTTSKACAFVEHPAGPDRGYLTESSHRSKQR
jgi:hypothetical protein